MTLPGFNAETSLYKTSIHYRFMDASVQADGVVLQQLVFCGPCFRDATGSCMKNCTFCFGLPRHCFTRTEPCDPSACPPFDPCGCRHRCCPSGVCHPGIERTCFLECITFCGE